MSFARVRALVVVGVLVVLALTFVVVALVRDSQDGTNVAEECPQGWKRLDTRLRKPEEIKINVYNTTSTTGLASSVANDFRYRKFQVLKEGNNRKKVEGIAVVRYGPKGFGSWQLLRAYFLNEAEPEFDPERPDDVVDVFLGPDFQQLGTTTEVNQALSAIAGVPEFPAETCPDKND